MTGAERRDAITLLRKAYAAFNRNEISAAVSALDPGIEWSEPMEFPGGGIYHGRDEVARYLANSRAGFAEASSQPEKLIVQGDRVVVFVDARIRPNGSTTCDEIRLADVYTFRSGMPVAMRAFANRDAALQWVGINQPLSGKP